MLDSFYAGVSGMTKSNQRLDVTGNNLANVNTVGFKKSRAMFKDLVYNEIKQPRNETNGRGGIHTLQSGIGVTTASIDRVHTVGNAQSTGRPLDVMLSGPGMFVVLSGENEASEPLYTRSGNFFLDSNGYLLTHDGKYVARADDRPFGSSFGQNLVTLSRIQLPADAQDVRINSVGAVLYNDLAGNVRQAGRIVVALTANEEGLEKVGQNYYQISENSGEIRLAYPGQGELGELIPETLEMSNVDVGEELTELILSQRHFQASAQAVKTSDEILQEIANLRR